MDLLAGGDPFEDGGFILVENLFHTWFSRSNVFPKGKNKIFGPERVSLSAEIASILAVFFFHNKSANTIFCHNLSAKRTS